jgi:hypothetical protein
MGRGVTGWLVLFAGWSILIGSLDRGILLLGAEGSMVSSVVRAGGDGMAESGALGRLFGA